MDLVAGVRKEGSRGGRADFKWEDVKDDQHRENYLGHSLMAPVGRWQKNRDLNWYAKSDNSTAALSAAEARAEEIRRIKEAEQNALSEALGYGPMPKSNPNEVPIGRKEVERAIKETAEEDDEGGAKGVGFGGFGGPGMGEGIEGNEVLGGIGVEDGIGNVKIGRPEEKKRRSRSRERKHGRHTGDGGRGPGRESGVHTAENAQEATREHETPEYVKTMTALVDDPGNEAFRQSLQDSDSTLEIGIILGADEPEFQYRLVLIVGTPCL